MRSINVTKKISTNLYKFLSHIFIMTIMSINSKEVLDSNGRPTLKVDLISSEGTFTALVPSGTSIGKYEALELRDENGGVKQAINNVNNIIAPKLIGLNPFNQKDIDNLMINLDGTKNKSRLGANAILGISMAVSRAGAGESKMPLYGYLQKLSENKKLNLPIPLVLVLEGGKHAKNSSDIQEFMILSKAESFGESLKESSEIYKMIGMILKSKKFQTNLGYEGAYCPNLRSNERYLELIINGIENAGYKPGKEIFIAIDSAASEFYENGKYNLKMDKKIFDSEGLLDFYESLIKKYPLISIEDPFDQNDWESWKLLTKNLGKKIKIVGDDLTTTNPQKIKLAINKKACNAFIIKPNQIGTISETINAFKLAKSANLISIISHRSGETNDSFIADLAVGLGAEFIKAGSPSKTERFAKYNRLLEIEKELNGL